MKTQNLTPDQKTKIRRLMDNRRRQLRTLDARVFPKYFPGMTAGEYVRRYNALNCDQYRTRITLDFDPETLTSESSTYDPLTLLCTEEVTE